MEILRTKFILGLEKPKRGAVSGERCTLKPTYKSCGPWAVVHTSSLTTGTSWAGSSILSLI
ncbi:hypothetical protein GQ55_6G005200 [Panicum hallii var. hallii]|uniref:Uncharacterized protein n=1 Tax=Panicum hallii var. hallii TaxID=1504633 RepID=A0A2T7D2J3_9POAL|nr:hypothetical protein GQ55_6G005200 [Panicum hallii var. hallii]